MKLKDWSTALIWMLLELCQVDGQYIGRATMVGANRQDFQKLLTTQDNLFLLFYVSIEKNMKRLE